MTDPQPLEPLIEMDIIKVTADGARPEMDVVATEVPVTIMAGVTEVATLMCTPEHLDDLAVGFLKTSGLLHADCAVKAVDVDTAVWQVRVDVNCQIDPALLSRRTYTSGCGKGVVFATALEAEEDTMLQDGFCLRAGLIQDLANWFRRYSELHSATGGVHTVALSEEGREPVLIRDDVGRHNAADKVVGRALSTGVALGRSVMVTSGRISSEIMHKAHSAGIPILISLGAPTHQAVLVARRFNLTLVGFARQKRFSIFSGAQRIIC